MRKFLRKAVVFALTTAIAFTYLPVLSAANTDAIEWDGSARIRDGRSYFITERVRLTSDVVIPENSVLDVRRGGELVLDRGMTLMVRGGLEIKRGGILEINNAEVVVRRDAGLDIYGTVRQSEDAILNVAVGGKIVIYSRGRYTNNGTINISQDGIVNNNGSLRLTRTSEMTLTGTLNNHRGAEIINQGLLVITLRGAVSNSGSITTSRAGTVNNSGRITLHGGSSYENSGTEMHSDNAVFIDNSDDVVINLADYKFTAAILDDEERVEILGIDVSRWQGDIDWQRVAASGVEFAILRAAHGNIDSSRPMGEDRRFREYAEGALAAGINIGVYMYSYATTPAEARQEAEFLVRVIRDFEITYPVVYDIEEPTIHERMNRTENSALIRAFFEVIIEHGYYPMLYSYKSFFEDRVDQDILNTYAVWVAHWGVARTNYRYPYHMWQYTDKGRVSGIRGDVDLNISYYDFAAILRRHGLNNLR